MSGKIKFSMKKFKKMNDPDDKNRIAKCAMCGNRDVLSREKVSSHAATTSFL
jgi:hypothetical protein